MTNLLESYERMFAFGQKHLNDLFVLDGIVNVSARDKILREIISNSLAHRDYSNAYVAKLLKRIGSWSRTATAPTASAR